MPTARSGLAAAMTGGEPIVYAIGGFEGNTVVPTVEAYDSRTDTWTAKKPMQTPRAALAAVEYNGLIYAIGGCNNSGGSPQVLDSVEVYDPQADSWATSPHPLPVATKYLAGAVGPNGLIYAIGGQHAQSTAYTADVYSYNPTAHGWARQTSLFVGRAALAAATGPDGLLYAIGGSPSPAGSGAVTADVEAYTYDKCDYIEYEIRVVANEIRNIPPGLPPRVLEDLRAQLANLEEQLKICRG